MDIPKETGQEMCFGRLVCQARQIVSEEGSSGDWTLGDEERGECKHDACYSNRQTKEKISTVSGEQRNRA